MEALTGDTIHCPGHTFNLIFLFSFFLLSQLRLEGKKSRAYKQALQGQTGADPAHTQWVLLRGETIFVVTRTASD